jgi:hypothetical protein
MNIWIDHGKNQYLAVWTVVDMNEKVMKIMLNISEPLRISTGSVSINAFSFTFRNQIIFTLSSWRT